jgi:hypothetical protein
MSKAACTHLTEIKITDTDEHVCEDCIKVGDAGSTYDVSLLRTRRLLRLVQE